MPFKLMAAAAMSLVLICGLSASVYAQSVADTPASAFKPGRSPVRIMFGGYVPGYSSTRKAVKGLFLGGGATFDLRKTAPDSATLSAYLDATGDESEKNNVSSRITMLGIGGQFRYGLKPAKLRLYVGSGAGLYLIGAKRVGLPGSRISSRNKTFLRLGGKILGGLEARNGFFGELSYTTVSSTNDLNAGGVGFALGWRL